MQKLNCGYIKLYRNFLDWGWYTDSNTARLFIHCIFKANFKEKEWQGIKIPVGSFVTSYEKLAQELKLSIQKIRTSLNKLKSTCEITTKTTCQYTIITVKNYSLYQNNNTDFNKQITCRQQTNNKQITTTKERNKEKKEEFNIDSLFKKLEEKAREEGKL